MKIQFEDLIGVPYLHRGRDPSAGLDCLGAVLEVYRRAGIRLGDYELEYPQRVLTSGQDWFGQNWPEVFQPIGRPQDPLDLVLIDGMPGVGSHIMVVVTASLVLHCREPMGVSLMNLTDIRNFLHWRAFRHVDRAAHATAV